MKRAIIGMAVIRDGTAWQAWMRTLFWVLGPCCGSTRLEITQNAGNDKQQSAERMSWGEGGGEGGAH